MIKPSIGRVVWYHPSPSDPGSHNPGDIHAAIIARVWSDTCINVAVFDSNGVAYSRTSVLLLQPVDEQETPTGGGYAEWMPYQIGQAGKAEQLQSKVDSLARGYTNADAA